MNHSHRILLADDEDLFRDTTAALLRKVGYAVDAVSGVEEAIGLLNKNRYDVLIADIRMPGNENLDLVLKTNESVRGLPIVLVTGYPTLETAVHAVNLAIAAYLIKPLDFDELLSIVRQCVARSMLRQAVAESRKRLALWNDDIAEIEKLLDEPILGDATEPANSMLATTFEMIAKSLAELKRATGVLTTADHPHNDGRTGELIGKLTLTRKALQQTIIELEESKHAFKSKRLGSLRRQLQVLVGILDQDTLH
jgi:YesN/AraC family two-component response regulator